MNYAKGLMIAAAIDLVWIMGSSMVLAPDLNVPKPALNSGPVAEDVDALMEVSERLDSLMVYLQEHPEDVDAIEKVADIYADKGWWDAAIGPLARAIQLDAERWSLWAALDRAVEHAGLTTISDAELTVKAQEFVDAVEMWGESCSY